ncbi:MAG TPA: RloB domain-containing protein, partial [Tenuifilaceae bacterium]|nr:RloB domain-containing protein [Tenuifilaceae bacterium]
YWFLLHFESTAKYYETCEKVIKQLKKHNSLAKYEKNRDYFTKQNNDIYLKLRPYLCNAIQNAKKLGSFDFNHSRSGMSQMQLIFEIDCLKKVL